MQIYTINHIINIDRDSISYLNNTNSIKQFSLFECSRNWVNYVNRNLNLFTSLNGNPITEKNYDDNNCVGQRDWFSSNPYYEFFADDIIRFEIRPKKHFYDIFNKHWIGRYYAEFHNISIKLQNVGWTTFDLG